MSIHWLGAHFYLLRHVGAGLAEVGVENGIMEL